MTYEKFPHLIWLNYVLNTYKSAFLTYILNYVNIEQIACACGKLTAISYVIIYAILKCK